MFLDESARIQNNRPRLSYGVAATDIDGDGRPEFVVTGYGCPNLVLDWRIDGSLVDVAGPAIADESRRAIGVAAGDANADGQEEVYVLNTDTFMGMKRFGDRFLLPVYRNGDRVWTDAFEFPRNIENPNLHAGRSVAAVDLDGTGHMGFFVANYGGPMRLHVMDENGHVTDRGRDLGIDVVTGGRSLLVVPDIGNRPAILCGNENDANTFFVPDQDGVYTDRAQEFGLADLAGNPRGMALLDLDGDGLLDIVVANWHGQTRAYTRRVPGDQRSAFVDRAPEVLSEVSSARSIVAADFDNDGRIELFFNVMNGPNRLFRVTADGIQELDAGEATLPDGAGTGLCVADVDGDGTLELLVAHGEQREQELRLFRAKRAAEAHYLRVLPLTPAGAPARGATVHLFADNQHHVRTVDAGSGYLCQMEPVAHFGLGRRHEVDAIEIVWPGGSRRRIEQPRVDTHMEVRP